MSYMPEEESLKQLWSRREQLSEQEWAEIYRLVARLLQAGVPTELDGLPGPDDRAAKNREYVASFFVDKVFHPTGGGALYHAGALREFYRRYLRDHLRRQRPVEAGNDEQNSPLHHIPAEPSLTEREETLLQDTGLTWQGVEGAARAFWAPLKPVLNRVYPVNLCGAL